MDFEAINTFFYCIKYMDYAKYMAAIAACIAAICAYFSYRLSKSIYNEIKSDETIIAGQLHHPRLQNAKHNQCVLHCTLFNKSQRKAFINSVRVYESNGNEIAITWSNSIDSLGNVINPTDLLGLKDSIELYLRRNDGEEFKECEVYIKHSYSVELLQLSFDPYYWMKESEE